MKINRRIFISGAIFGFFLFPSCTSYGFRVTKEDLINQNPCLIKRSFYQSDFRSTPSTPILKTVVFKDTLLEKAIKEELSLPESTILTTAHLSQLYTLEVPNSGITQLDGLEYATNLITLNLNYNQVSDLTPLTTLQNIEWLKLEGNQIQTIEPLRNFTKLKQLTLSNNPLESIKTIQNFTTLQSLDLANLGVANISSLEPLMQLSYLNLEDNQIKDLNPLSNKTNLTGLYLNRNNIQDISPLKYLNQLEELYLISNKIQDVSPLAHLSQLQKVRLNENQISDFSSIQSFNGQVDFEAYDQEVSISIENLLGSQFNNPLHAFSSTPVTWQYPSGEWAYLSQPATDTLEIIQPFPILPHQMSFGEWDQKISWIIQLTQQKTSNSDQIIFKDNALKQAILDQLSLNSDEVTKFDIQNLYELNIENSNIQSLEGLEYATNLITLNANGNQINDLTPLSDITTLEWVKLNDNQITSITPLLKSKALKQLSLVNNPIQDISPISTFSDLIYLTLDGTKIKSWTPLIKLTNLEVLSVNNNDISDVTSFSKIANLQELHLYDNQIKNIEPLKTLTNLTTLNVSKNQISDLSCLKDLPGLKNVQANDQQISIFINENKAGKEFVNPIKTIDGSSVSWQLTTEQEESLELNVDSTLIILKKNLPSNFGPIMFAKDGFSGWIQLTSQQTEGEVALTGTVEPTILSITIPTKNAVFKINPNLPSDQMFIATEFSIINQSMAPLEVDILAFEEKTDLMNDVLPNAHENWESLADSSRFDFALGLTALSADGWEIKPKTTYVAETYPRTLGIINGNDSVSLSFEAKHGKAFKQNFNPEYRLVFSFQIKR